MTIINAYRKCSNLFYFLTAFISLISLSVSSKDIHVLALQNTSLIQSTCCFSEFSKKTIADFKEIFFKVDELKLKLTGEANTDETIIRFFEGATDHFDSEYDATKTLNDYPNSSISSILNGNNYAINSLPDSILNDLVIPLSFSAGITGTYTLSALKLYKFDSNIDLYLIDTTIDTIYNLREDSNYVFTANQGLDNNRFFIHFNRSIITKIKPSLPSLKINIWGALQKINFVCNDSLLPNQIRVYNICGEEITTIAEAIKNYENYYCINLNAPEGIYIVKINLGGIIYSEKVYINK